MITEAYRDQQRALHATGTYGVMGEQLGPFVTQVAQHYGVKTLLDYGCGSRQSLRRSLGSWIDYRGFDPCVEAFSADPAPADMVACIDVMEHVEPEFTDATIERIAQLTKRVALVTVHTGPAIKVLSDGRNAHIVQQPFRWWLPKFLAHFELERFGKLPGGFLLVLSPVLR
jgi:hypothetical protein